MTDRESFVRAVLAGTDPLAELAFADWLADRGEPAAEEFVRLTAERRGLDPPKVVRPDVVQLLPEARTLIRPDTELLWLGIGPQVAAQDVVDVSHRRNRLVYSCLGALVLGVEFGPIRRGLLTARRLTVATGRDHYPHRARLREIDARLAELKEHSPYPRDPKADAEPRKILT